MLRRVVLALVASVADIRRERTGGGSREEKDMRTPFQPSTSITLKATAEGRVGARPKTRRPTYVPARGAHGNMAHGGKIRVERCHFKGMALRAEQQPHAVHNFRAQPSRPSDQYSGEWHRRVARFPYRRSKRPGSFVPSDNMIGLTRHVRGTGGYRRYVCALL